MYSSTITNDHDILHNIEVHKGIQVGGAEAVPPMNLRLFLLMPRSDEREEDLPPPLPEL